MLAVLLAFAVTMTGCIGGEDPLQLVGKPRPDLPPAEGAGHVLGAVATVDAGRIGSAVVEIPQLGRFATMYGDGSYLFLDVPAGAYTIRVRAPGYVDAAQPIVVAAGGDVRADFLLVRMAVREAWSSVTEHEGLIECAANAGVDVRRDVRRHLARADGDSYNATGIDPMARDHAATAVFHAGIAVCSIPNVVFDNATAARTRIPFALGADITTLVSETEWSAGNDLSRNLTLMIEVDGFGDRYPGTFVHASSESPFRARFGPDAWQWMDSAFVGECARGDDAYCGHRFQEEGFPLQFRAFPSWECLERRGGACLVLNQAFTHYAGAFYGAPAPSGWTVLGGT